MEPNPAQPSTYRLRTLDLLFFFFSCIQIIIHSRLNSSNLLKKKKYKIKLKRPKNREQQIENLQLNKNNRNNRYIFQQIFEKETNFI